jgi:hypothetical protein
MNGSNGWLAGWEEVAIEQCQVTGEDMTHVGNCYQQLWQTVCGDPQLQ